MLQIHSVTELSLDNNIVIEHNNNTVQLPENYYVRRWKVVEIGSGWVRIQGYIVNKPILQNNKVVSISDAIFNFANVYVEI